MTRTTTLSRTQLTESMIRIVLPAHRREPKARGRALLLTVLLVIALAAWLVLDTTSQSTPTAVTPLFW
jgi:hypothetical protein